MLSKDKLFLYIAILVVLAICVNWLCAPIGQVYLLDLTATSYRDPVFWSCSCLHGNTAGRVVSLPCICIPLGSFVPGILKTIIPETCLSHTLSPTGSSTGSSILSSLPCEGNPSEHCRHLIMHSVYGNAAFVLSKTNGFIPNPQNGILEAHVFIRKVNFQLTGILLMPKSE